MSEDKSATLSADLDFWVNVTDGYIEWLTSKGGSRAVFAEILKRNGTKTIRVVSKADTPRYIIELPEDTKVSDRELETLDQCYGPGKFTLQSLIKVFDGTAKSYEMNGQLEHNGKVLKYGQNVIEIVDDAETFFFNISQWASLDDTAVSPDEAAAFMQAAQQEIVH